MKKDLQSKGKKKDEEAKKTNGEVERLVEDCRANKEKI